MIKIRVIVLLATLTIVGIGSYLMLLYARGYRLDEKNLSIKPSGLLIAKSNPEGAQVLINQEVKGVTNTNFSLPPGTYDITIKKEGYSTWQKRITIKKEEVTEISAHLFRLAPSLSALTLNTVINPNCSPNGTKIAFVVPATKENIEEDKEGLWILDNINLPLGFSRDPRRITDGDLKEAEWIWSPNGREIILTLGKSKSLLDTTTFTPQSERINIATKLEQTEEEWQKEKEKILASKIKSLPDKLAPIIKDYAINATFSPDETKILYTAKEDYEMPEEIIKPIPGASTQKQERSIKKNNTYVYDIKEDRNFLISEKNEFLQVGNVWEDKNPPKEKIVWLPTSSHLLWAKEGKVIIMDYDGTNKQEVYSGSYFAPFAFPTLSNDRIIILTNLGSSSQEANLYYVTIR